MQFEFIPKLDEDELCKPWIKMNPNAGLIMPGKKLCLRSQIIITGLQMFAKPIPKHKQNLPNFLRIRGKFQRSNHFSGAISTWIHSCALYSAADLTMSNSCVVIVMKPGAVMICNLAYDCQLFSDPNILLISAFVRNYQSSQPLPLFPKKKYGVGKI